VEEPGEGRIDPRVGVTQVPALRREVHPRRDLDAARAIRHLIADKRPDIVHTNLAKAGALGRREADRAGIPVIVHTFHGHVLEGYFPPIRARVFLWVERRLARRSSALVAVSASVRDDLLAHGIGRPEQWRVIPLGLELDELLATPGPDPASARVLLGLPAEGTVVGIVGRLAPIKDHGTFLAAAARVAAADPGVTFAIVGDGELRPTLETTAREQLGERVRFTGWVEDLPSLYAALDVVALTSRNEGTPVALIEAAAAGKPSVATRVGGVADVVVDGRTGALVSPADPEALAGAILGLVRDPLAARAQGEAARDHVRVRFAAARHHDETAAMYEDLLGRAGLPGPSPGIP